VRALPTLIALVVATPARAGAIDIDIACAGTFAPGDTVPYTATLDEQNGLDHLIDVTITLDTPVASRTVLTKTIFLFANQLVTFTRPLKKLPANAVAGVYTATLTVTGNGKTVTDTCTFDVL
jgi:uncharacterized protein YfaS (alpha-2-macroglobulin family)